jgi:hypothetical protein
MDSTSAYKYPKLKGSANYKIWRLRTEAVLLEKGYNDVLYPNTDNIDPEYANTLRIKGQRAAAVIRLSLEDGPLIQTEGISDANDLLGALKTLYDP